MRDVPVPAHEIVDLNTYREVFFASPDYISISRLSDGRYIEVNPGFEEFTGYDRNEVIGKTSTELAIWPDMATRAEFVTAVRNTTHLRGFATRLRTRAGVMKNIEASGTITVVNGEPVLVAIVRDVTERKRLDDELAAYRTHLEQVVEERTADLRYLAQHDVLTGLPNRALMTDRMNQAILHAQRLGTRIGFLIIDLDRFKPVNDQFGHHVGDGLLRLVADRLRNAVRKADTVARLGGDEFVVLLLDVHELSAIAIKAAQLLASLQGDLVVDGHALQIGVSIGIATYPRDGTDAAMLVRYADAAMYEVKKLGGGRYRFCGSTSASADAPIVDAPIIDAPHDCRSARHDSSGPHGGATRQVKR